MSTEAFSLPFRVVGWSRLGIFKLRTRRKKRLEAVYWNALRRFSRQRANKRFLAKYEASKLAARLRRLRRDGVIL